MVAWIDEMIKLCKPDRVYWCDGSKAERKALLAEAVERGILIKPNQKKLPGCYYHRSNPAAAEMILLRELLLARF